MRYICLGLSASYKGKLVAESARIPSYILPPRSGHPAALLPGVHTKVSSLLFPHIPLNETAPGVKLAARNQVRE